MVAPVERRRFLLYESRLMGYIEGGVHGGSVKVARIGNLHSRGGEEGARTSSGEFLLPMITQSSTLEGAGDDRMLAVVGQVSGGGSAWCRTKGTQIALCCVSNTGSPR